MNVVCGISGCGNVVCGNGVCWAWGGPKGIWPVGVRSAGAGAGAVTGIGPVRWASCRVSSSRAAATLCRPASLASRSAACRDGCRDVGAAGLGATGSAGVRAGGSASAADPRRGSGIAGRIAVGAVAGSGGRGAASSAVGAGAGAAGGSAATARAVSSGTGPAAGSSGTARAVGSAGRSCRGSSAPGSAGRPGRGAGLAGIRSAGSTAGSVGPTDERARSNSRRVTFSRSASLTPRPPPWAPRPRDPVLIARVALKVPVSLSARS
ncbi:hypothetical protein ELQ87_35325 [Streptomyces griseoviridis]|uniref:Uncharacterized protein n=1 Tax=Streptomyces griseoviridis TaxID=45398 RepID=A0A3Q9KZ06_STRGD|nr:hypothetical protein [Streptomyces griseoviridis]AZS88924.1 hypothetical protein ELQ87_35325 [Streptomyces griseoviridis]